MPETYTGAEGTDAANGGLSVMDGGEQWAGVNGGWRGINKTRDMIAQLRTWTTAQLSSITWSSITGKPAVIAAGATAAAARAVIGVLAAADTYTRAVIDAAFTSRDNAIAGKASQADLNYVQQGNMTADVYNRVLSGSYRVAYVNSSGVLGWVSSSRRYKKSIRPALVDPQAVLTLELVTFLYKAEIDTERLGELQYGLIAEQLDELGLDWLVDYGQDGQPEGVRYDRLALALLPVVQQQATQLEALADRVSALEGHA